MKWKEVKPILTSLLVGACVAFFSTLFDGLAEFMKTHATDLVAGGATSFHYLSKTFKS